MMALLGAIPAAAIGGPQVTRKPQVTVPPRVSWRLGGSARARWGPADGAHAGLGLAGSADGGQPLAYGTDRGQPGSSGRSVVLDDSPGVPLANPQTSTVYVPIQCTTSSCITPERVMDIISAATCNVKVTSGCRVIARAAAGTAPTAAAMDAQTGTIYVADGSGTVTVINGARCNAGVTSGCAKPLATIKTGGPGVAAAFDPKTRTVYVASPPPGRSS